MGDSWDHLIKLGAKVESKPGEIYPKLLAAKSASPPEEIGGIYHYNWALVTLNEPERDDYEETVSWFSDDFDPNADVFPALEKKSCRIRNEISKKIKKTFFKISVGYRANYLNFFFDEVRSTSIFIILKLEKFFELWVFFANIGLRC